MHGPVRGVRLRANVWRPSQPWRRINPQPLRRTQALPSRDARGSHSPLNLEGNVGLLCRPKPEAAADPYGHEDCNSSTPPEVASTQVI